MEIYFNWLCMNFSFISDHTQCTKSLKILIQKMCLHLWYSLSRLLWPLRWRHNEGGGVSSHQPYDCLLNRLFRHRSKKTSKLRVTGLCVGNSPGSGEFPAQMASNAENVSVWWRHHAKLYFFLFWLTLLLTRISNCTCLFWTEVW